MDDLIGGGHHALGGDRDGLPTDELVNSGFAQFQWPFQLVSGEKLASEHSTKPENVFRLVVDGANIGWVRECQRDLMQL